MRRPRKYKATLNVARKGAAMLTTKAVGRLQGLMLALLLMGCAGMTIVGAGCSVYAEARKDLPWMELEQSPKAVVDWFSSLEAGMAGACLK